MTKIGASPTRTISPTRSYMLRYGTFLRDSDLLRAKIVVYVDAGYSLRNDYDGWCSLARRGDLPRVGTDSLDWHGVLLANSTDAFLQASVSEDVSV